MRARRPTSTSPRRGRARSSRADSSRASRATKAATSRRRRPAIRRETRPSHARDALSAGRRGSARGLRGEGRRLPRERRAALESLLPARKGTLFVSRRMARDGKAAYRDAKRLGWEGIIAKDEDSIYEPGTRSRAWLKVKVRRESEFVIGGYTEPKGGRDHFGALLVGLFAGPALRYVGKVGTGFTHDTLASLATKLERIRTATSPFDAAPRMRDATWVRPKLVAQLAYAEWTADG